MCLENLAYAVLRATACLVLLIIGFGVGSPARLPLCPVSWV
jgi:hypothetical protein